MKIVLTVQLQQDDGQVVATGNKELPNFSSEEDANRAIGFLGSIRMQRLVATMASIARNEIVLSGTPNISI